MRFEQILEGIFLLKVPFDEDVYTSVFAVVEGDEIAVIDAATTDEDVDSYIVPALRELMGRERARVTHLLLTHTHGDHAGGLRRLSEHYPDAKICSFEALPRGERLSDGDRILGRLRVVHLPGHTLSSVGYLCEKTGTLLSGDCLQLRGVGRYTRGVRYPDHYLASLERLETMGLSAIIASHDYVPLGQIAEGGEAVKRYLDECRKCAFPS